MGRTFQISRNEVVINSPPEKVFDYLSDMARHGEWDPEEGFTVTFTPAGPTKVGSVRQRERNEYFQGPLVQGGPSVRPVSMVKTVTLTTLRPNRELAFETKNRYNGLLHSAERVSFNLEPDGPATRVTMVTELESMVPGIYLGPFYVAYLMGQVVTKLLGGLMASAFPGMCVGPRLSRVKSRMERQP